MHISFIAITMNNRDRYEIIGLCKISHSIKQSCRSVGLKKAFEMHQSCLSNAVHWLNKVEN